MQTDAHETAVNQLSIAEEKDGAEYEKRQPCVYTRDTEKNERWRVAVVVVVAHNSLMHVYAHGDARSEINVTLSAARKE